MAREHLTRFLNPTLTDEATLRELLAEVPVAERAAFLTEARARLDGLERVFRPLSEVDGQTLTGPDYPAVQFDSAEQLLQIAAAMRTLRRKRRLLTELLEP